MAETDDGATSLNERLLDVLVYAPAGLLISVAEEFPRLAELGRQKLGVQVSSARAIGQFAVRAGCNRIGADAASRRPREATGAADASAGLRSVSPITGEASVGTVPTKKAAARVRNPRSASLAGVPDAGALAIPGYDTLSASQVVQRLDGLSRVQLDTVRTYEVGTRGRRTIIGRLDQLLAERA